MRQHTKLLTLALLASLGGSAWAGIAYPDGTAIGTGGVKSTAYDGSTATVSAAVTLTAELEKTVAIATIPEGSTTIPIAPEYFGGIQRYWEGRLYNFLDRTPLNSTNWRNLSAVFVSWSAGLYANTEITVEINTSAFVHESDPSSSFLAWHRFLVGKGNGVESDASRYINRQNDYLIPDSIFPYSEVITDSELAENGGKLLITLWERAYLDTLTPDLRAGTYTSTATITITTQ